MKSSIQKIWLWGGLAIIVVLALLALWVSEPIFARMPSSEGDSSATVVRPGLETTLTSPDGRVTLTFPTNFFSVTLVVTYTERAIADLPPNLAQIGPAFTLEAVRASDGQPVTIYEVDGCSPVGDPDSKDQCVFPNGGLEIVFHYTDAEITSVGISSDTLALAYHYIPDGISGKWLPLTTVIDDRGQPDNNQAVASTWYLTHFALLGIVRPAPLASTGQVEIIVDDLNAAFTQHQAPGGENYWWHYWAEGGTYNEHSYYTKDSDPAHGRQNWGTWTPDLPESGTYEIWAFIPWNHATTTSTHYMVERDGSPIGTATINQLAISADWVSLGTYSLPAGTHTTVILDDMTNDPGYAHRDIGFDALKFVCQDCGAPSTPTPGPTPVAFTIQSVAVVDANGNTLPWDALVRSDAMLTVEVHATGDQPPADVWVQIDALQSQYISGFPLPFQRTVNGIHIYRGSKPAAELVIKPDVITVAAVAWDFEPSETDFEIAEELMNNLGIPPYRRRGIAWQDGDQARNHPPANLDYFRAAGYEVARLSVPAYPGSPQGKFYVQNQADVLFYLGHGNHVDNYIYLSGEKEVQGYPNLVGDNWNKGLQTVIFYACSEGWRSRD